MKRLSNGINHHFRIDILQEQKEKNTGQFERFQEENGRQIILKKIKKRIVIKVGSSSIIHESTGGLDYTKLEKLIRIISDLKNQDKDVVLVSSGAIGVGAKVLGLQRKPRTTSLRQACASVGQGQLMMIYQKLFYEYHQIASQVLLTFDVISSQERRQNAINTFNELLQLDVIPVVNENDTVAIEEVDINFGDNDTLSAIVASMIHADLLLLLTDIDGLYTDDPRVNPNATLIPVVERIDDKIESMAKGRTVPVRNRRNDNKNCGGKDCNKLRLGYGYFIR